MSGESHGTYTNPLLGFLTDRLQGTFLKCGSTTEFYEILEVAPNASQDKIRSAYRTISLKYHPDKIRQRQRRDATEEEKEMDLKIKEVYKVLSDPKKRKLYNRLGSEGYRYAEEPNLIMQGEDGMKFIIGNYQKNNQDKVVALSLIFGIIFATILLPILVCLKADGDLPNSSWVAIWTPAWIFDVLLLCDGVCGLFMPSSTEMDEDGNVPPPISTTERLHSLGMVVLYILFIAFQVLLMARLDGTLTLNWFVVFLPWILWEALRISWLVLDICSTIPEPELEVVETNPDDEEAGHDHGGVNSQINMDRLMNYYQQLLAQDMAKRKVFVCALRLWFALFLAAKVGGGIDWNWGLVMLPLWIFLVAENCFACYYKILGDSVSAGIDGESLQYNPNVADHAKMMYGTSMSGTCMQMCLCQGNAILVLVLLVCALQVNTGISSFLVVLPIWFISFLVLLSCCCFFCCMGMADTNA
jgi:hypothetical protein